MGTLKIVTWPEPVLLKPTEQIKIVDLKIKSLAENMVETMYAAPGVGLAANQVGKALDLIVVDTSGPEEESDLLIIIHPEIAHLEGNEIMEEGCLSLPGFKAEVPRALHTVVRGYDIDEKPIQIEATGLKARALQHEIDHLKGKLFPDRLSRLKKNLVYQKVRKAIKGGTYGIPPGP